MGNVSEGREGAAGSGVRAYEVADAQIKAGQRLADELRRRFGFDMVGVSVTDPADRAHHRWQCVSGNVTARYQRLLLPEGVGVLGQVSTSRRAIVSNDVHRDIPPRAWYQYPVVSGEGLESFLSFPLIEKGEVALIVICGFRETDKITPELSHAVQAAAAAFSGFSASELPDRVLEPHGVAATYAEETHRLIQAQEDERKRISRELHDSLAQELLLVQIELRRAKYLPADQVQGAIDRANEELREALSHVSSIAQALRPAALEELGLAACIEAECNRLAESFGIQVEADIHKVRNLGSDCELALYRIMQEASLNACKYSRSDRLQVALSQTDESVVLAVRDFGVGFDTAHPEVKGGGLGLSGMRERAAAFDGVVNIESAPGAGCSVTVTIPCNE